MNAKDLITDFYVRLNKDSYFFKKGQILKVMSINFYQYIAATAKCQDAIGYVSIVEVDNLDPIPLTLDILKELGFEMATSEVQKYILWEHKYTVFAKGIDNGAWEIDIFSKECKLPYQSAIVYHVHQLQQWLHLCGIEREIKMSSLTSVNTI